MRKYTYTESMKTPPKYIHRINKKTDQDETQEACLGYIKLVDETQINIEFTSSLGLGELQRGQLNEWTS